jgi:hypothetical protein
MEQPPHISSESSSQTIPFSYETGKVHASLTEIIKNISDDDLNKFMREKENFEKKLLAKYPNARQFAMFHALIGSSITNDMQIIGEDFPDESDSVEGFINRSEYKYSKKLAA